MKNIYMDHAATTPLDPRVLEAMKPYFSKAYGNASSIHSYGQEAREALEEGRGKVASIINAQHDEIVFTSGGTESDNLAIRGSVAAFMKSQKGRSGNTRAHIITSTIEHDAVLHTCQQLEDLGHDVTYLKVDRHGLVDPDDVRKEIRKNTAIVSIMHANNEIGTIQPIAEIGRMCKSAGVPFHTDAVQTFGKLPIDVKKMGIDLLSASAHKLYGPKGVGALYLRSGTGLVSQQTGGGHERGYRSGTENVSGIVGFGRAAEIAGKEMGAWAKKESAIRDKLISGLMKIPRTRLNGHPTRRLPNNVNVAFSGIEGESMVIHLDMNGVSGSTGSACSSKSLEPSHVLLAIGMKHSEAHGSLRLSLGKDNTMKEADKVISVLPQIITNLRRISPLR